MLARTLLVVVLILTVGCDQVRSFIDTKGARKVLAAFMDARMAGATDLSYNYLASSDRRVISPDEWEDISSLPASPGQRSYRIVSVAKDGAMVHGTVEITQQGAPNRATHERWNLIREANGWKIFLDEERQRKARDLLRIAKQQHGKKMLKQALETYAQVLELDSDNVEAIEGTASARRELAEIAERRAYAKKIRIYDFKSRRYDTFGGEVPGVRFNLRNEGDRSLKMVEVTVYFEDSSGAVIAEKNYHPVLVSKRPGRAGNKPLNSGKVWRMASDRFYKAASVPSHWEEGAASAQVTELEFE